MTNQQDFRGWLIVAALSGAVGASALLVARAEPQWLNRGPASARSPSLDLRALMHIDPRLICFAQTHQFPVELAEPCGIAVADDGTLYVVGDQRLVILTTEGTITQRVPLEGRPTCVGVSGPSQVLPRRVYIGFAARVDVLDSSGNLVASWRDLGQDALVTSIASGPEHVYVADAANRVILRCDFEGKVLARLGAADALHDAHQFVVPSAHFDVAVGPDKLILVANPGARRIEAFSPDGTLESYWGSSSSQVEGFFGCCNPAHFAVLPDGTFVTSEKGVFRVKVYGAGGEFQGVVAGPAQLGIMAGELGSNESPGLATFDVAADRQGRVLLLDARECCVRIFERNRATHGEKS